MRPRKGMTAQRIVNILEQSEIRLRDNAKAWERLDSGEGKLACEKMAEIIRSILEVIAE